MSSLNFRGTESAFKKKHCIPNSHKCRCFGHLLALLLKQKKQRRGLSCRIDQKIWLAWIQWAMTSHFSRQMSFVTWTHLGSDKHVCRLIVFVCSLTDWHKSSHSCAIRQNLYESRDYSANIKPRPVLAKHAVEKMFVLDSLPCCNSKLNDASYSVPN